MKAPIYFLPTGDSRHSEEAFVTDGRRGATDLEGEGAAEEVQGHEARIGTAAAAALLKKLSAVCTCVFVYSTGCKVVIDKLQTSTTNNISLISND